MTYGVDEQLLRRLNELEVQGRSALGLRLHRRALERALRQAAPLCAVGPALCLLLSPWAPSAVLWAGLGLAVAAPFAAVAIIYLRRMRAGNLDRASALAWHDHRLELKDRVQTVGEFTALDRVTGFQSAALAEAAPWLEAALSRASAPQPPPLVRDRRLWLWPAAGGALVAVVLALAALGASSSSTTQPGQRGNPLANGEPGAAVAATVSDRRLSATGRPDDANGAGRDAMPGSGGQGRPGLGRALERFAARLGLQIPLGGASADTSQAAAAAATTSAGGADAGARGRDGAAGRGGAAASNRAGEAAQETAEGPRGEGVHEDDATASNGAARSVGAGGRQIIASQPQVLQEQSATLASSGSGRQPARSQRTGQGTPNRDDAGGQGDSSGRAGEDPGAKRGRGVASLFLATPMQDRLGAPPSPGRISTSRRDAAPQALPGDDAAASDRAPPMGLAALTQARSPSAHDERLVRDFFVARNVEPR